MKSLYIKIGAAVILVVIFFFYLNHQVYFSRGTGDTPQNFEIKAGDGVSEIGKNLESFRLIKDKYYFFYYVWRSGSKGKIQAGKYELRGSMTIPEIVQVLSVGEVVSNEIKVTFPEGLNVKDMAEILKKKGFDGDDFLAKVNCGCGVNMNYDFLKNKPQNIDLEGYLFPDTYTFFKNAKAVDIINRMFRNFDEKMTPEMRAEIENQGKSVNEIVTMASILEKEVRTPEEMKITSGIFWDRMKVGMPLQSCATIAYVLGQEKKQYSFDDTRTPSPYNTYLNRGLPPGPIDNPGTNALKAAIYPTYTDYNYFLTDPETGKAVFSKTIEEHNANKAKYGL